MQLRDYRKAKGLTLHDMADLVGWGFNMVSRHERGISAPTVEQVEKYRKATGGEVEHRDWVDLARRVKRQQRAKADALPAASTPDAKEKSVA